MLEETVIEKFLISGIQKRFKIGKKYIVLAVLFLGSAFLLGALPLNINSADDSLIFISYKLIRCVLCFCGGMALGVVCINIFDKYRKIRKIRKKRYFYRFETCVDIIEESGTYKIITDSGKDYNVDVSQGTKIGDMVLFFGIEGYGHFICSFNAEQYQSFMQPVTSSVSDKISIVPAAKEKISVEDFLTKTMKVHHRIFVILIICFFIGFLSMLYSNYVEHHLFGYVLRACGCAIEVGSILIFIRNFLNKTIADEAIKMLEGHHFTYRIESFVEVSKSLDAHLRMRYKAVTDSGNRYHFTQEVGVGDRLLIADIDEFGKHVVLIKQDTFCYEFI